MGARFVHVPAERIRERLLGAGFVASVEAHGEEVYVRTHDRDKRYTVKVYTSISVGSESARECGADAIRVVTLFADPRFRFPPRPEPLYKAIRVHRSGSVDAVLDRMIERAREAYSACNAHRNGVQNDRG
jgi:hypothetical protein